MLSKLKFSLFFSLKTIRGIDYYMKIHSLSLLSFQYLIKKKAGKSGIFMNKELMNKVPNKRERRQILLVPLSTKNVEDTSYFIVVTFIYFPINPPSFTFSNFLIPIIYINI